MNLRDVLAWRLETAGYMSDPRDHAREALMWKYLNAFRALPEDYQKLICRDEAKP